MEYDHPTPPPQRLTDPVAGYGEPSQAALDTVERLEVYLATLEMADVQGEDAKVDLARWFDRFAAQAVAAREAEIVAALEESRDSVIDNFVGMKIQEGISRAIKIVKP